MWSIFALCHGHSICDGGFAHGKRALRQQIRKRRPPARSEEDTVTVLSHLKNHSAELVLESADRDFHKVATMSGISQFFHFTFKGGNTVLMSQLAKDPTSTCAYKVFNEYTDGRNPVRKVDRVLVDEVLYESD